MLNLLIPDGPRYSGHVQSRLRTTVLTFERGPGWNDVEEAIAWARERAPEVLVRLGETMDSAGASDRPPDPDDPDDVVLRWPPSGERIREALVTLSVTPDSLPRADRDAWHEAAHEHGALRIAEAFDDLVAALASDDQGVIETAALALVDLGDRRAVGPLVAVRESASRGEPGRIQALFASEGALARFDDPEAREALARFKGKHDSR